MGAVGVCVSNESPRYDDDDKHYKLENKVSALNNPQRVEIPLNRQTKPTKQIAQSAGAVEYTDCTSAEG